MQGNVRHPRSTAFLLAQVGAHAAARFAGRLAALDLSPAHAGTLRVIEQNAGISQQALSSVLGMVPSRLVVLVDELEERGLVERRDAPDDRRTHALHLTRKGAETFEAVGRIARAHDDDVCAPLGADEREVLGAMLRRIADHEGLTPGVHPGFSRPVRSRGGAPKGPRGKRRAP
ncbi:MAG: MarR family transcriptional regulator [Deltaproteobacteria bacterium]|nr:MAG: MarR family transcriptional regulator [Deltaproteobacteria bacterium]TMB35793.1 MAG: MarR family transcriptional regulator [Deltaproteobacteria bacterium]